jgi:hypothetical protein
MHHPTADRPIEHPLGHFQTTCAFLTPHSTEEQRKTPISPMYERRPALDARDKKLPVPRSCGCHVVELYNEARTHLGLGKDLPWAAQFSGPVPLSPSRILSHCVRI